jgi:hypothetical protein
MEKGKRKKGNDAMQRPLRSRWEEEPWSLIFVLKANGQLLNTP